MEERRDRGRHVPGQGHLSRPEQLEPRLPDRRGRAALLQGHRCHGHREPLWRSDGTEAGTFRIEDVIAAGPSGGIQCARSPVSQLFDFGGTLFFAGTGNDGTGDLELWRSDGTQAGTFRVKDIFPGPNSSSPYCFVDVGGTLFFAATDGTSGQELWRTDGTEAGTLRVKDIAPGGGNSTPSFLTDAGGTLFFTASDASSGELWRSDGTEAGTVRVADINPGERAPAREPRLRRRELFFSANDGVRGREPWVLVRDLEPVAEAGPDQTVDEGTAWPSTVRPAAIPTAIP